MADPDDFRGLGLDYFVEKLSTIGKPYNGGE
ncbi:hypothetical protein SAMN06296036_107212 [Pseudobacteriovorax antillogorgiicola]|uniref:Uncharacterized protein n=1 Tax=Pseudobacteriovorax antillogorgiicola TaxID=1513793 RepID=A0A1Y6BQ67_9BACT|nr:hypothetical protein EDD56_10760 [Pseudobacteriovorax antillogorgiicola]SMF22589.1 hypothetical protein SAMN06296036_107212 [Pseudobacteriovorax antillogorgiicola]